MAKITRRSFIQATGVAGAASLLGFPQISLGASKKVVIVGGGIGGATTAQYIRRADPSVEVTLIEPLRAYHTCFMSNEYLGGGRSIDSIRFTFAGLKKAGVRVVHDLVTGIDASGRVVKTKGGDSFDYDRCIVSPGIDFKWESIQGYDASVSESIPHAYKAGPQTVTLRKQLMAMKDGGTVIIAPPPNPFRCPPGPYERASQIAHYLKYNKPKSKILILDPKEKFSKFGLFRQGWKDLYGFGTNNSMIEWVPPSKEGKPVGVDAKNMTMIAGELEDKHKADVLNIIPAQKAGKIAFAAGLTKGDWCPVDLGTFESKIHANIHVIGDASIATGMPKSGYAANSQAKVCAASVVALLNGMEPGTPSYINTCYSIVGKDYGISVAAVYRLGKDAKKGTPKINKVSKGGLTATNASAEERRREVEAAHSWFNNITGDVFG